MTPINYPYRCGQLIAVIEVLLGDIERAKVHCGAESEEARIRLELAVEGARKHLATILQESPCGTGT